MPFPGFQIPFSPLAEPAAVIHAPQARFTILTERLVRMEYSPMGEFEDRPSQVFWFRRQPVPAFDVRQNDDKLEIETAYLQLTCQVSPAGAWGPDSLSVLVKATGQRWRYGDTPWQGDNLWGTARTLDDASGKVRLEPGLVGRAGWAVVDDTHSLVFDEAGWLESRGHSENLDLYFFGYGHDYPAALSEFSRVAGSAPLIPRWILGNWWSRYWAYSQDELLALMSEFKEHQVPLTVCIVDMDWHITQTGNRSSGWTGYTWNGDLFPDPPGFIAELHKLGLKTALNLHPAEGVHPHEAQYSQFAEQIGLDPTASQPVPFDCADPQFMQAYFEVLHHPYEEQGIDFWWIDWQQGKRSRLAGMDPLWWLNHLHYYDLGRDGLKRSFVFSRWGGLGNHRYPIGFSGDTVIGWEALGNQPSFTATAANVGYGWWSHDIGGHMLGVEDDELYSRWVQFGTFSPILRLHSTNNPYHERRPWRRGPAAEKAATVALRLRHALIPYIYSMAWRHYTTGLPLITPMYYSHPEEEDAYQAPGQYWFGSELLAAPFTTPVGEGTRLARQPVWLAQGDWFDFFTGEYYRGGRWLTAYGELQDIPVFARAGAIIPQALETGSNDWQNPEDLSVLIFPGADNRFELVEDDGQTQDYQDGVYAITLLTQVWRGNELIFTISPVRGDSSIVPEQRRYHLLLRGSASPVRVEALLNEQAIELSYSYDQASETLSFGPLALSPRDELTLTVQAAGSTFVGGRDRTQEKLTKYLQAFHMNTATKFQIEKDWLKITARQKSLRAISGLSDAQLAVLEQLLVEGR